MDLRIVGAGLPRTGTTSLYTALPRLLGAPCYHMRELVADFDRAIVWRDALQGREPDWDTFLAGYAAGVDWPFSCFWRELAERNPDAIVLLSSRDSADRWYDSMSNTVLNGARRRRDDDGSAGAVAPWLASATEEQRVAADELWGLMGPEITADPDDRERVKAVYERHNATVRAEVPAHRLLEWQPGDGWEPLCAALGVPVPDEPFPHENSTTEMRERLREAGVSLDR